MVLIQIAIDSKDSCATAARLGRYGEGDCYAGASAFVIGVLNVAPQVIPRKRLYQLEARTGVRFRAKSRRKPFAVVDHAKHSITALALESNGNIARAMLDSIIQQLACHHGERA